MTLNAKEMFSNASKFHVNFIASSIGDRSQYVRDVRNPLLFVKQQVSENIIH